MPAVEFWARRVERAGTMPRRASILVDVGLLSLGGVANWVTGPHNGSSPPLFARHYLAELEGITTARSGHGSGLCCNQLGAVGAGEETRVMGGGAPRESDRQVFRSTGA
jgi:hypothetical protein